MRIELVAVDLKNLDIYTVRAKLLTHFIIAKIENNLLSVIAKQATQAQSVIDKLAARMPDLVPVQFHYMLNKYGFDDAIAVLLPALKTENLEKYAMYKAYLEQARFYEFEKALVFFNDIKGKFVNIDERLDFTVEQLKTMWKEASKV